MRKIKKVWSPLPGIHCTIYLRTWKSRIIAGRILLLGKGMQEIKGSS
jgi:hypothetical protein